MKPDINAPVAWAYVRLSRDDLRQPGTIEEKFVLRKVIAQRLADQHGLALPDDHIIVEKGSGGKLQTREGAVRLLAMAKRGDLKHLITPYVDRLLRGDKRDEQDIEDALCIGNVRVYTAEQDHPIAFGPDYDPTLFEIKAFVARSELRGVIRKRRETDRARLQVGKRSRGAAPYGYRYLSPVYDAHRNLITAASHAPDEAEFAIVSEAWQRIRAESLQRICADFNARGVRPPGEGKRVDAAIMWTPITLRNMLRNPFYAGYLSQRVRKNRGMTQRFDVDDFILSDEAGDWPAVVSLAEWRDVQDVLRGRYRSPGGASAGSLTGLLRHGTCGNPMFKAASDLYRCGCGQQFHGAGKERLKHLAPNLSAAKIEGWARNLVAEFIKSLPDDAALQARSNRSKSQISAAEARGQLLAVNREMAEARRTVEDMMLRRSHYEAQFGKDVYQGAADRAAAAFRNLQAQSQKLAADVDQPDIESRIPLIMVLHTAIAEQGAASAWGHWSDEEQSAIIRFVIRSITVTPDIESRSAPGGPGYAWRAAVEYWPWIEALCTPPALPMIAKRSIPAK